MADEKLSATLQHAVLAALCFDQGHGAAIAAQVLPAHFDNSYRDFATRVLTFRRRYQRPPGPNYLEDLVEQVNFGRSDNKLLKQRLLPELMAQAEGLNAVYVESRVQDFIRRQTLKGAIIEAGDRYSQDDDRMVPDVERIFHKALQYRQHTFDAGVFLNDPKGLAFVDTQQGFISLGIPELDQHHIGLYPREMLLYIAAKGTGKTWFCCHCGVKALLQRQRVVHYSLEMDELKILRRYHQSIFGVARDSERYTQAVLEFDSLGRLSGFDTKRVKPKLDFSSSDARKVLRKKMEAFGTRLGGLLVKSFPTNELTLQQLDGHLDYLADVQGFIPNVLIVDYPDLMHVDTRDFRIGLGRTFSALRGVAVRRNMALVVPTQGNRGSHHAKRVRSSDVAEDITKVNTADTVLSFSATEQEKRLGMGRLSVEHARDTRGGSMTLLSQAYSIGQYVMESASIQQAYWERLKEERGEEDDEEE